MYLCSREAPPHHRSRVPSTIGTSRPGLHFERSQPARRDLPGLNNRHQWRHKFLQLVRYFGQALDFRQKCGFLFKRVTSYRRGCGRSCDQLVCKLADRRSDKLSTITCGVGRISEQNVIPVDKESELRLPYRNANLSRSQCWPSRQVPKRVNVSARSAKAGICPFAMSSDSASKL